MAGACRALRFEGRALTSIYQRLYQYENDIRAEISTGRHASKRCGLDVVLTESEQRQELQENDDLHVGL